MVHNDIHLKNILFNENKVDYELEFRGVSYSFSTFQIKIIDFVSSFITRDTSNYYKGEAYKSMASIWPKWIQIEELIKYMRKYESKKKALSKSINIKIRKETFMCSSCYVIIEALNDNVCEKCSY